MPTQTEIARHLDLSERRVRDVLAALGVDHQAASMDEIRVAYLRDLRDKAGGRGGEDQKALTRARTMEATASAELKILMVKEKSGQVVLTEEVEPMFFSLVTAARTELLSLPGKLVGEIKALYDVEVDVELIEEKIHDALRHLASGLPENAAGDDGAAVAGVGAAPKDNDDGMGD